MDRKKSPGTRGGGPKTAGPDVELPLRITLLRPPAGVRFCLQRGKDELVSAGEATREDVSFDFAVRVKEDDGGLGGSGGGGGTRTVRLLGEFTQGPPGGRFVYVRSGTMAGQPESCWSRRAKVPLAGITPALVRRVMKTPGARLEARIQGTGRDGGPVCASVKLLGSGWQLVR